MGLLPFTPSSRWAIVAHLTGCAAEPERTPSDGTEPTESTVDYPSQISVVLASCTPQVANVLRADCTVTLDGPAELTLTATAADETLVFHSTAPAIAHDIVLWGLLAGRSYEWVASVDGGIKPWADTLTTGPLPDFVAGISPIVTGQSTIEAVAMPFACGRKDVLTVVDTLGNVRWYEALGTENDLISGIGFLPDSAGLVGLLNNERIIEIQFTGQITKDWTMEELGLDNKYVHHMAFSAGEILYLLTAEEQVQADRDLIVDGVIALDFVGNVITEWKTTDALDLWAIPNSGALGLQYWGVEFPGAEDITHLNGVHVDEFNRLTASLYSYSTVFHVDFDPTSPTYLDTLWRLAGTEEALLGTDFVLTASAGGDLSFVTQHHPTFIDGHLLTLSDNRSPTELTRTLEIEIDTVAGTADIVQRHALGAACPTQGSVFLQGDGSVIATCARAATVYQFADGAGDVAQWTMEMSCDPPAIHGNTLEVKPVDLPVTLESLP